MRTPATLLLVLAISAAAPRPALAQAIDAAIAEAAAAAGLPAAWVAAVVDAESGRDPRAVSRAGALGLMQLMPRTWRELRGRLGLGPDPFDRRDNLLAGAVYLREMLDRFGAPGFLAAYNAGPARYAAHLAGRAALPRETRAYLARLAPRIGASAPSQTAVWTHAPLFPQDPRARERDESRGVLESEASVGLWPPSGAPPMRVAPGDAPRPSGMSESSRP